MVIPYMPMLVPPVNWTGYVLPRFHPQFFLPISSLLGEVNLLGSMMFVLYKRWHAFLTSSFDRIVFLQPNLVPTVSFPDTV